MPANVMTFGVSTYIKSFSTEVLNRIELAEIERK